MAEERRKLKRNAALDRLFHRPPHGECDFWGQRARNRRDLLRRILEDEALQWRLYLDLRLEQSTGMPREPVPRWARELGGLLQGPGAVRARPVVSDVLARCVEMLDEFGLDEADRVHTLFWARRENRTPVLSAVAEDLLCSGLDDTSAVSRSHEPVH